MTETRRLKNVVIFVQSILSFVLSRKIITIIFKINVFKLCERYSKLLRISIGLGFFKNYYKDIKTVSKENEEVLQ